MTAIKVPPLGESIVEATISRWLKKEGDPVAPGESIVELETDKITVDVPSMVHGVLKSRAKQEGEVVRVDDLLCEIEEGAASTPATGSGDKPAAAAGNSPPAASPAAAATASSGTAAPGAAATASSGTAAPGAAASAAPAGEARVSPAAARTAADQGIDATAVAGTGRGGVVSKADVIAAAENRGAPAAPSAAGASHGGPATPPAAPAGGAPQKPATPAAPTPKPAAPGERETREKMTTRRKKIAEHLLESQHATAHLTTFNEIDMTVVNALRERHKERVEKQHGLKLSLMPFFVKAAVTALKEYPVVNAQIDGDAIVYKHYVNMGIAVASDAGLVVPNLKDVDRKSMIEIGKDLVTVAKRARDGKLTMDDLTGGTFTITNGGVFGSLVSTPIINFPQVAILGLHKTQDRPVAIDGKVEIRPMMYVALSYDHRIIDGQQAVLFLVKVKEMMEDPAAMML